MDHPAVSIVTPSFNICRHLRRCLESVADQSCDEFEHIVVDGASTDGSVELLETWDRHAVTWVSEPDRGQSHALNKGFGMAKGEVIGWLNADDVYEPWTVSRVLYHFRERPELDLVYGYALVIDAEGRVLRLAAQPRPRITDLYLYSNFLHQPAVFFRRSLVDRFGGLDETLEYTMDYEFWLRIGRQVQAAFVPEILARLRLRPGSKMDDPGWKKFYKASRQAYLRNGGRRFSPMLLERMLNRWVEYPVYMATWPFRKILWRLMGVPWREPFRMR